MVSSEVARPTMPIKGLTAEQVHWKKFYGSTAERKRAKEWSPSRFDFSAEAFQAKQQHIGKHKNMPTGQGIICNSPELVDFLNAYRPPTLFLEPQSIASLLTPDSDIIVNHSQYDKFQVWNFTLNPKKYEVSDDVFGPNVKQTITLTRGNLGEYGHPEPYLRIGFPAKYDGNNIIFYPKIATTYGDGSNRDELDDQMIKLLQLEAIAIPQQIKFSVREAADEYAGTGKETKIIGRKMWGNYLVGVSLKNNPPEKVADKNALAHPNRRL
jgi:hypothetical protein